MVENIQNLKLLMNEVDNFSFGDGTRKNIMAHVIDKKIGNENLLSKLWVALLNSDDRVFGIFGSSIAYAINKSIGRKLIEDDQVDSIGYATREDRTSDFAYDGYKRADIVIFRESGVIILENKVTHHIGGNRLDLYKKQALADYRRKYHHDIPISDIHAGYFIYDKNLLSESDRQKLQKELNENPYVEFAIEYDDVLAKNEYFMSLFKALWANDPENATMVSQVLHTLSPLIDTEDKVLDERNVVTQLGMFGGKNFTDQIESLRKVSEFAQSFTQQVMIDVLALILDEFNRAKTEILGYTDGDGFGTGSTDENQQLKSFESVVKGKTQFNSLPWIQYASINLTPDELIKFVGDSKIKILNDGVKDRRVELLYSFGKYEYEPDQIYLVIFPANKVSFVENNEKVVLPGHLVNYNLKQNAIIKGGIPRIAEAYGNQKEKIQILNEIVDNIRNQVKNAQNLTGFSEL